MFPATFAVLPQTRPFPLNFFKGALNVSVQRILMGGIDLLRILSLPCEPALIHIPLLRVERDGRRGAAVSNLVRGFVCIRTEDNELV